jgi:hypothetical protein
LEGNIDSVQDGVFHTVLSITFPHSASPENQITFTTTIVHS